MPSTKRATCTLCGRRVRTRRNGTLREHRVRGSYPPLGCAAAGAQPVVRRTR